MIGSIVIHLCSGSHVESSRFKQYAHIKPKTPAPVQEKAVLDLITRLIGPTYASQFTVVIISNFRSQQDLDTFEYVTNGTDGKLVITATSGVAAALGFSHFLKYFCHCQVSWSGNQVNLPEPFPSVRTPVSITSPNRCVKGATYRYLVLLLARFCYPRSRGKAAIP